MAVTDWKQPAQVKAYVEPDLLAKIELLAQKGDRSVASELRRALREHVRRSFADSRSKVGVAS